MADSTIPNLTGVTTPAAADEFITHQSGDTRALKNTRLQNTLHISGSATNPGISFVDDDDNGFYRISANRIGITMSGAVVGDFIAGWAIRSISGGGLLNETSTATNPVVTINTTDIDTGLGGADDAPSMIAGAVEAMRWTEATSVLQAVEADVGLTAATDSIQGTGVILSSYNVYDTVASAGDAATLPAVFTAGSPSTFVYIKNGAAANSMDVFPASGDDAGGGTDTAVAVAAGDFAVFMGTTANATWEKIMGGTA